MLKREFAYSLVENAFFLYSISMKKIEKLIRKAILSFNLIPKDQKIAIALSGGKDSLTLLDLLSKIQGKGFAKFDLKAFHVRGTYSCGASQSLKSIEQFCSSREVDLTVLEQIQKREQLKCYPCSRQRRSLLFRAAKTEGYNTIAFGHHKQDHLETLMMNVFNKGEFLGLKPKLNMTHYEQTIIRPLIYVEEHHVVKYAQDQKFLPQVCQCPVGQTSHRREVKNFMQSLKNVFPYAEERLFEAAASTLHPLHSPVS